MPPAPTMDTTMEVVVEEDCTRTVARTPIIMPAIGLVTSSNIPPAEQPPSTLKEPPIKSRENKKKYKVVSGPRIRKKVIPQSAPVLFLAPSAIPWQKLAQVRSSSWS